MTEGHLVVMALRTMKKMLILKSSTIVRAVLVQMKRRWMIRKRMLKWLILTSLYPAMIIRRRRHWLKASRSCSFWRVLGPITLSPHRR